jgi:uncharacterized membrane protein YkoI
MRTATVSALLLASAFLVLAGCAGGGQGGGGASGTPTVPLIEPDAGARASAKLGDATLSIDDAMAIAQEQMPGRVLEIEAANRTWGTRYEVNMLKPDGGVGEVKFSGINGEVFQIEDPKPMSAKQREELTALTPMLDDVRVSYAHAFLIARTKFPGGWPKGVELFPTRGGPKYKVEFYDMGAWVRVEVDAVTAIAGEPTRDESATPAPATP